MRYEKGAYYNILAELQNSDTEPYRNYLWMNHETFQVIFSFWHCLLSLKRYVIGEWNLWHVSGFKSHFVMTGIQISTKK